MANLEYSDRQWLSETDMTIGDLKQLIEQVVQQTVETTLPKRSAHEVLTSMQQNLWTPPSSTPSNLEILREDRDQ
jgi:hypothetical protein